MFGDFQPFFDFLCNDLVHHPVDSQPLKKKLRASLELQGDSFSPETRQLVTCPAVFQSYPSWGWGLGVCWFLWVLFGGGWSRVQSYLPGEVFFFLGSEAFSTVGFCNPRLLGIIGTKFELLVASIEWFKMVKVSWWRFFSIFIQYLICTN